jgi:RNA polymerase sigma-70 factor (ECF subfamily)
MLVRDGNTSQQRSALGTITHQYWKPVYCYLRSKGHDSEAAKDLTQGFFTDVILGRQLVTKADPDRGRFRSFLLSAVNNYVLDCRRKTCARSRSPESGLISLEGLDSADRIPEPDATRPEVAYHQAWASALLRDVLAEVEDSCRRSGQETHWAVFTERVLEPIVNHSRPTPYVELCDRLGISSRSRATTMHDTVRRKFQSILSDKVRQFVDTDADVQEEIRDLMSILGGPGAPRHGT